MDNLKYIAGEIAIVLACYAVLVVTILVCIR